MLILLDTLISSLVIFGYGFSLTKLFKFDFDDSNFSINFFLGIIALSFLGLLLNVITPLNKFISSFIFFFGIFNFFFYLNKKNFNIKKILYYFSLSIIIASILLIFGEVHDDFGLYHLPTITKISQSNISFGEVNLHFRFGHNFSIFYLLGIFKSNFINSNYLFLPLALIYSWYIIFLLERFQRKNSSALESTFCLFLICVFLIKFYAFGEHGIDIPVAIFFFIIFFLSYDFFNCKNINNIEKKFIKIFIFSFFLITLKISQILVFLIPMYFLLINGKKFLKKKFLINLFFILSPIYLWFVTNVIISSCAIYPVKYLCYDLLWSPPLSGWNSSVQNVYYEISAWSKGWIDSLPNRGADFDWSEQNFINSIKSYLNSNWYFYWINVHFKNKILPFVFQVIFIYLIFVLIFKKKIEISQDEKKFIYYLLTFSILNIIFWFNTAPLFRFGFPFFLIFLFLMLFRFYPINVNINYKKTKFLVAIFLCVFIFRNINNNIENLNQSFLSPYPDIFSKSPVKKYSDFRKVNINNIVDLKILNEGVCYDIDFPCTHFSNLDASKLKIEKYGIFKIFRVLND